MGLRWRFFLYVVANCAYCVAKSVSLNEVIAAESQQKQLVHAASPKLEELAVQRFSLNKGLKPLLRTPKKLKETDGFIPFGSKTSSLKYRKAFQIKSPLRPKRIKHSLRRLNHKNQSVKREISGNGKLNQKYIPLLRSLGMLFDNLLDAESSESNELRRKRKRVRYYTETSEFLCPCSSKSNVGQSKETADSAKVLTAETSSAPEATTKTPHPTAASHFRGFRQNKNIPLLLPRNTPSGRRDYNGFRERSRSSHHRSTAGNITRDHGDSEHGPGDGSHESDATDDEEDPGGHSRDNVRSFRPWRRIRVRDRATSFDTRIHTEKSNGEKDAIRKITTAESESITERPGGNFNKPQREDKQQVRRDEAESAELLSAPTGRLRGFLPADEVDIPESEPEESESHVEQDHPSDQQLIDGSSTPAEENKETSTGNEALELFNIPTIRPEGSIKEPIVFIIDGYSVTRNKNGENKLKEKAIHIHSK